jgi:hypothetical protein
MRRVLQMQRTAHEGEVMQLKSSHGEETAKLQDTILRMEHALNEGMVEFDELAELWTKSLSATNASLRRRIKVLETQVFKNSVAIQLERKVKNQRQFMNRAARAIEILFAEIRRSLRSIAGGCGTAGGNTSLSSSCGNHPVTNSLTAIGTGSTSIFMENCFPNLVD